MPRERKIILIVGMGLLLLGVLYRYAPEMGAVFSGLWGGEELRVQRKRLASYRAAVAEKDGLQKELVAVNQALARTERRLLSGNTPALAGVDLQNLLNDVAARSRVDINSMRVLKAEEAAPGYLAIPVQVDFKADIRQILDVFYRLETAAKTVRIVSARLRVANAQDWQEVNVSFTAEGFMAGEIG